MRMSFPLLAALSALAGLGLANWQLAITPVDVSPVADNARRVALNEAGGVIALNLREVSLLQASSRPLFAPDRRPWTAPAPVDVPAPAILSEAVPVLAAPEPALPAPEVTLIGIQMTPKGAMALLADQSGGAPVWLADGEQYRDWKISGITASSANLANGASAIRLDLYPPLPGGAAGP
ncbi:MAG: hypothetical protein WCC66_11200 [Rhizobiaceae bacterium]